MSRMAGGLPLALLLFFSCACTRPVETASPAKAQTAPTAPAARSEFRVTGIIQAVRSVRVTVPQIQGQMNAMTLTQLIPNGSGVKEGELVATFDATPQVDAAREAQAKFEDLSHQVEQKAAENRANGEKRVSDLRQAEADLSKALLQLSIAATLPEITRLQNEVRAQDSRVHVASLKNSMALHEKSDAAALRILELQRDRQKIAMQRAQDNIKALEIHAPQSGMVVYEFTRRGGSWGHAREGDQLFRNLPLLSIFDPSEMQVRCSINEPDIAAALQSGGSATVYLDAYPGLGFPSRFAFASPVASSGLGTSIKSFTAVFQIEHPDPRLLPDLSAAIVLALPASADHAAGGAQ